MFSNFVGAFVTPQLRRGNKFLTGVQQLTMLSCLYKFVKEGRISQLLCSSLHYHFISSKATRTTGIVEWHWRSKLQVVLFVVITTCLPLSPNGFLIKTSFPTWMYKFVFVARTSIKTTKCRKNLLGRNFLARIHVMPAKNVIANASRRKEYEKEQKRFWSCTHRIRLQFPAYVAPNQLQYPGKNKPDSRLDDVK